MTEDLWPPVPGVHPDDDNPDAYGWVVAVERRQCQAMRCGRLSRTILVGELYLRHSRTLTLCQPCSRRQL